jgi:hypothetical protein
VRTAIVPLVALLGAGLGFGLSSGCSRAQAVESFELGEHDKLLAEAPGCWAECRRLGPRRLCTVKDYDCKPICQVVPECKPDGMNMLKVCVVMKGQR